MELVFFFYTHGSCYIVSTMLIHPNIKLTLTIGFIVLTFLVDISTPLGIADWLGYIFALFFIYGYPNKKAMHITVTSATILTVAGYFLSPSGIAKTEFAVINRLLVIIVLWAIVGMMQKRIQAEEEATKRFIELQEAFDTIKTLEGFIPICASCKKIRNDEGFWEQIEYYISQRTDAKFSHGICPDCIKKLYPNLKLKSQGN